MQSQENRLHNIAQNLRSDLPQITVDELDHEITAFEPDEIVAVEGEKSELWVATVLSVDNERKKLKLKFYEGILFLF